MPGGLVKHLYWRIKSIIKNLKKGKIKSFLRFVYDSKYRNDINYMLETVRQHKGLRCINHQASLREIVQGHEINYPEWVDTLVDNIRINGYMNLEPIKVIWDPKIGKFLIVDGNHRFIALRKSLYPFQVVNVKLLVPISLGEIDEGF